MNDNVLSLSKKTNNGQVRTPEDALKDALDDIGKEGALTAGKKLLIIALDDSEGYRVTWYQAGMKMSECLTLCEVAKIKFLTEMELIQEG